MRCLVFDMDGTIADLYAVPNWLEYLKAESPYPYANALPFYDMARLAEIVLQLKQLDYRIIITSWLSKQASTEYKKKIREAKKDWLNRYNFPYDELHIVQYGTPKSNCTRKYKCPQILIDDEQKNLKTWKHGDTINARLNLINELNKLLTTP